MTARRGTRGLLRASAVSRAAWACALLFVPERLVAVGRGGPVPAHAVVVSRVLGTRQLLQSAVTAVAPRRSVAGIGVVVDALHAATDVALAVASPRWRRAAVVDALVGAAFIAAGWAARSLDD